MGRVEIRHGSVSCLPFSDNLFDFVTAVDSHYYWPDLAADVREVFRVLKPDGTLMIIGEELNGRLGGRCHAYHRSIGSRRRLHDAVDVVQPVAVRRDILHRDRKHNRWPAGDNGHRAQQVRADLEDVPFFDRRGDG
jgi:SAM-dependent methyltransferase